MRWLLAAGLLTLSFQLSPAMAQPAVKREAIGPWTLKSGLGGNGPYCTIEFEREGKTVGLQIPKTGPSFFGLQNPDWSWAPGKAYRSKVILGGRTWSDPAVSPLPTVLVVPVSADSGPIEALAAASSFSVTVENGPTLTFALPEPAAGVAALRACIETQK